MFRYQRAGRPLAGALWQAEQEEQDGQEEQPPPPLLRARTMDQTTAASAPKTRIPTITVLIIFSLYTVTASTARTCPRSRGFAGRRNSRYRKPRTSRIAAALQRVKPWPVKSIPSW